MRRKINGYILLFTSADQGGRHIHVYRHDREIGVHDLIDGPIRGLDAAMNVQLRETLPRLSRS